MFYSQSLVSRNGPFGNIWIAAYCLKKLKKHQIADTDITSSIEKIIPEVEIPYRMLAQLLLGVVRIFSKQVDYLYHDCNKALANLRNSFIFIHPTAQKRPNSGPQHDLQKKVSREPQKNIEASNEEAHSPEQNACAPKNETLAMQIEAMCVPYHDVAITLPEHFELDAFDLDVRDGGDTAKPNEEFILEDEFVRERDEWRNEKDQHCFLNEHRQMEVDLHAEYNSACFTPVEDVIPYTMMDLEIDEVHNSCNIEVSGTVEKSKSNDGLRACSYPGAYMHVEQDHPVNLVISQDKMTSDIQGEVQCDGPKNQVEPGNLYGSTPAHNKESHSPPDGNSEAHNKSDIQVDSGLPLPKFAVKTPARKETRKKRHQKFRKRMILFDETIVLSNGTMKMWINDASNLVCKRRKVPHTSLDAWKAYRITNLQKIFTESVIPYISCEHKAILDRSLADYLPQKTSASSADAINLQHEVSKKSREPRDSLQGRTISDTPPPEVFSAISTPERSEVRVKESSPIGIATSALDIMEKDQGSSGKESNDQDAGWSVRTRVLAKYLYDKFLDLKEQKRDEVLNLDQMLQGETRAKSARFFYGTLTLKSHGCIDVKQDSPYGDIIVSASPQFEVLVKKNP